jgi:hypothetical protein
MLVLAFGIQLVLFLGTVWLSARWTVRAKTTSAGILKGALLFYGLILVSAFLSSVVIPGLLLFLGADRHAVISSFPEAICMTPILFLGWLPALFFSAAVRGACERVKNVRTRE